MRFRLGRLEHFIAGWRDGRKGLPAPEAGIFTHRDKLQKQFDEVCERLWRDACLAAHEDIVASAERLPEIERAGARYADATANLKLLLEQVPDLAPRYGEQRMPATLIEARRGRERARRTAELDEIRIRCRNYLFQLRSQQEAAQARIDQHHDAARSQARVAHGLYSAWLRSYIRGGERTHYNPHLLLAAIGNAGLQPPPWQSDHPAAAADETSRNAA